MKVPAYWKPREPKNALTCDAPVPYDLQSSYQWQSILEHDTCYAAEVFDKMMIELVYHPERTSSVIMRTDIILDSQEDDSILNKQKSVFENLDERYQISRWIDRRIIPRNTNLDATMDQTVVVLHEKLENDRILMYLPHLDKSLEQPYNHLPYYHPAVAGIAFHYKGSSVEVLYLVEKDFQRELSSRLLRTAHMLLLVLHKHCKGAVEGYQKRMLHDTVVERNKFQDTYVILKDKYAKQLVDNWVEKTDPGKHVFEDLAIAAFLIELWKQTYSSNKEFSFVDVGCGNGLLVYLLLMEGYNGYGFDARKRKSWETYPLWVQVKLYEKVLVPYFLHDFETKIPFPQLPAGFTMSAANIHDGRFSENSFLIGNHADELTPYLPILARLNQKCYFMSIPCCVHDLTGAKISWALPKPRNPKHGGRYAMYIEWLMQLSEEVGWNIEVEPLRIPSTRNYALIGRKLLSNDLLHSSLSSDALYDIVEKNHGSQGFFVHAMQVAAANSRSH